MVLMLKSLCLGQAWLCRLECSEGKVSSEDQAFYMDWKSEITLSEKDGTCVNVCSPPDLL